jgi:hypothetical protein
MEKRMAKYLVDVGLLVSGGLCAITGIIKLPGLLRYFDLRSIIFPAYQITMIHDMTGVIFVILVIAHLVFNWRWLAGMTQTLMKPPK